tara:strand:+ start:39 stop:1154 length:1116 start_codon:yes stop_codon:yes gene_type:complete
MPIFSRISKRSALSSSDQSDKSDVGPTASLRSSVPLDSMRLLTLSTASEPPMPAKDLRSRSSLGDSEFTEQAVRFVLRGGGVRKFEKSGKSRPHGVEMRLIPCAASGPLLVCWDDAKQKRDSARLSTEKQPGKLGTVVRVEDDLFRQTARVDEFKGDAYFDKHLDEEVLFFTITLRSRSLFLLAASTLEKELWLAGAEAIQSGEAARMPELLAEVERATAPDAPQWLKKVVDSLLAGDEIAELHATRDAAHGADDSMRPSTAEGECSKTSAEESSSKRGSVEVSPRTPLSAGGGIAARPLTAASAAAPAGTDLGWSARLKLPHLTSPAKKVKKVKEDEEDASIRKDPEAAAARRLASPAFGTQRLLPADRT